MKAHLLTMILCACCLTGAVAQHDMNNMQGMEHKSTPKDKDDDDDDMKTLTEPATMNMHGMTSGQSLSLPMFRDGSGTSWVPDATPMYGYMVHTKSWMFMFHGDVFVRYNKQDIGDAGYRGGEKFDAPDMLMATGQHRVGQRGLFHFNIMLSTDALIAGGSGYPLLFQTGESWQGRALVDRQHPHDLFSELSVSYAYQLSHKADISLYAGYPGEPALGPVTFMHRPSGAFMPDAPLGHHWADATHITFGVATIGLRLGKFKLEGSSFTGREPDEDRYNFDKPLFDSRSGRLSFNPSENWALQASTSYIKSPEALHPDEDINRSTASATYVYPIGINKYFSATALVGQNKIIGGNTTSTALAEGTLKLKKLALYARYEWVQKSAEELGFNTFFDWNIYNINELTIGAGYDLLRMGHITIAPGAQFTVYSAPSSLDYVYGRNPMAVEVYLHIYPGWMN